MRSLSWKLAGALLLIVIISVGLTAYLANLSTAREFNQYIIQGNAMHAQGAANSLAGYYGRQQSWNGVQAILPGLLMMNGDRLIVADASGVIVGDTDGTTLGSNISRIGLNNYGTPVIVSGQTVGSFYFLSSGASGMMGGGTGMMGGRTGMMGGQPIPVSVNTAADDFLNGVNRSLWIAGLASAFLALLLGLILTRQITRPIRSLTKGVRQISQGNLSYRVKAESKDEIGELGQSFNTMAASLASGEQSRRRMTADIAHELRTPLTIIEGTVDGMLDGVFAPDREHLTSIKEQTGTLTRLIGDLRELSLIESGQLKLNWSSEDINDLVQRKMGQVQVKAQQKNLQLNFKGDKSIPLVSVDRLRLEQVMTNLLTNAIRHTPEGGAITVSVARSDALVEDKEAVLISVADTGEGIPAEHLPHIFERFYRVDGSRSRNEGGTGLGLAIVKHLVQVHGGKVWAESEPGKGSTLLVALPLRVSARP